MRFLFLTWDGAGNQPPAIGIAQELSIRGHEVIFAGYASQRSRFEERGFAFRVLARSQAAFEGLAAAPRRTRLLGGVMVCPAQREDVLEVTARERADAILVDCLLFAALMAAEDAGAPAAMLVHSAPGALLHPDGFLERELLEPLNAMRVAVGRKPVARVRDAWARLPALCATIPQLDPLAREALPSFAYIGPVFERTPPSGWRTPWPSDDERPLVLVSFSTSEDWRQRSRIQRTLDGLAGRPYRVFVTTGKADVEGLAIPENAMLTPYAPHAEVLPHVSRTVTHAGHGTLSASLAHSIPVVCLPNSMSDQMTLAAHVETLGAGRALDGAAATADDIAMAVEEILADQSYAAAAQRLAELIAATPGRLNGASRLEALAGPRS